MNRIKVEKNKDYTTIHNRIVWDKGISLKAKGLYFTLMTLPDDWNFTVKGLISILKESKDSVNSTIKELIGSGYVSREERRISGKFAGYDYYFYETPQGKNTVADNPHTENTETVKPHAENQYQLSIDKESIDLQSKNKQKSARDFQNFPKAVPSPTAQELPADQTQMHKQQPVGFKPSFTLNLPNRDSPLQNGSKMSVEQRVEAYAQKQDAIQENLDILKTSLDEKCTQNAPQPQQEHKNLDIEAGYLDENGSAGLSFTQFMSINGDSISVKGLPTPTELQKRIANAYDLIVGGATHGKTTLGIARFLHRLYQSDVSQGIQSFSDTKSLYVQFAAQAAAYFKYVDGFEMDTWGQKIQVQGKGYKKHLKNFIPCLQGHGIDGAWNEENWISKLEEYKRKIIELVKKGKK